MHTLDLADDLGQRGRQCCHLAGERSRSHGHTVIPNRPPSRECWSLGFDSQTTTSVICAASHAILNKALFVHSDTDRGIYFRVAAFLTSQHQRSRFITVRVKALNVPRFLARNSKRDSFHLTGATPTLSHLCLLPFLSWCQELPPSPRASSLNLSK